MYGINVVNFSPFLSYAMFWWGNHIFAITVTKPRHVKTFGLWDFLLKKVNCWTYINRWPLMHLCYLWQKIAHFRLFSLVQGCIFFIIQGHFSTNQGKRQFLTLNIFSKNKRSKPPFLQLMGDNHPCLVKILPIPCYCGLSGWVLTAWANSQLLEIVLLVSTVCAKLRAAANQTKHQDKNQIFAAKFCCMLDPYSIILY